MNISDEQRERAIVRCFFERWEGDDAGDELPALLRMSVTHPDGRAKAQGMATNRAVTAWQAKDGTIVEVFEWEVGGVERAHANPAVTKLWERYALACDFVPLASLPESSTMFASFVPLTL